ncbi:hypothetical protein L1285_02110 [Pseudoalteromonas sp. DL2-H2.2]|uniref:hypothetical protein n=1 Tax=Pseudoalteromonas sp. DL2-H2.2 TaxID=2908889 RepID=UPI001F3ED1C9|nr:hypothetical protein [Pseudoalteromonas sp. DL2-H2.2]MCF2907139.1 hypothetical protein [Pseudoalteromonas sp. DL2-H2.2]
MRTLLPLLLLASGGLSAAEVKLNWEHKQNIYTGGASYEHRCHSEGIESGNFARNECSSGTVKFIKSRVVRDRLEFDIVAHNNNKDKYYQCLYITSDDSYAYMDDDLGDEYKGVRVKFKSGQDNKLAPNQRKKVTLSIPKPSDDATLVNLHFGFKFHYTRSIHKCSKPTGNFGINFNKLNWDIIEVMGT